MDRKNYRIVPAEPLDKYVVLCVWTDGNNQNTHAIKIFNSEQLARQYIELLKAEDQEVAVDIRWSYTISKCQEFTH